MITQAQIQSFFNEKSIAISGVSRNPKKFGSMAFKTLAEQQKYTLLPINPNADQLFDTTCYKSISSLPSDVNAIVLLAPKSQTTAAVREAMAKGIKNIWIQQTTETPETIELSKTEGFNIIYGKCIMMFANPKGFHKFHRSIMKLFGKLPK